MARRALRASAALFLLIIIALSSACNAKAADVPPEDKTPETAAELAAFKQKEKDRMFFLPSNATIPEPGNGTSQKTNVLGAVKQIVFVRHGEHAYLNETDTPCMSDIGMARAVMLPRYLSRPDAPKGVLSPTVVYAMNGDMKEDDPLTVRPMNTAIPYVVTKKIAPERFIRKFGQRTPADVAASMLSEGRGQVILNIWLHWEVPAMIRWMGVPITGWNSVSLDDETQATYKPVIVMTPGAKGVLTQLFNAPKIDPVTFLPDFESRLINKVFWESLTSWEDVARQQGNVERVVFPAGAAAAKKEKKEEEAGKAKKEEGAGKAKKEEEAGKAKDEEVGKAKKEEEAGAPKSG